MWHLPFKVLHANIASDAVAEVMNILWTSPNSNTALPGIKKILGSFTNLQDKI